MTFKKVKNATYEWPIKFNYPAETDGKIETEEFLGTFKRYTYTELKELEALPDKEAAIQVLLGWRDIVDKDESEYPYNEKNKEDLFEEYPGLHSAVVYAWFDSIKKVAEKNLKQ